MTDTLQRPRKWTSQASPVSRDIGAALAALSNDDLLRVRAIARLRARGLPAGMSWSDLLHEAVLRALAGTRTWPPDVPLVAFLTGIMRSLCDEQWRRHRRQDGLPDVDGMAPVPAHDPERTYAASQALAAVHRMFTSDEVVTKVIAGLMGGLEPEEIRRHYGVSPVEYDTARRRLRRAILRHGLAW